MPSGSPGRYTTIRAESDWGVTIDEPGGVPVEVIEKQYVHIQGIHARNFYGSQFQVIKSDHVKVIRCSSDGAGLNASAFNAAGSSYVLFEENFAYGVGRYPFAVRRQGTDEYPSHHVVFRRCACRWAGMTGRRSIYRQRLRPTAAMPTVVVPQPCTSG